MSEFLNNHNSRTAGLIEYGKKLITGQHGRTLYDQYQSYIDSVTSEEAMTILDSLIQTEIPLEVVKENVGKIMNVFYKSTCH
jgi:uncharacterized protein